METINAFRELVNNEVEQFVISSKAFESSAMDGLANLVKAAFEAEYFVMREGIRQPEPDPKEYAAFFRRITDKIGQIDQWSKDNWGEKDYVNHMTAIANAILALNWITVKRAPAQFVRDMKESGDYYGNRVLTANKGSPLHSTWVNCWNLVMAALESYVRKYHLNGFTWDIVKDIPEYEGLPDLPLPPPPPPAPPIVQMIPHDKQALDTSLDTHSALMKQINRGVDIQRVLKPVNRNNVPEVSDGKHNPMKVPDPHGYERHSAPREQQGPVPTPVFTLEGKKWRIENQSNAQLQVDAKDMSQSLAMFRCRSTEVDCVSKLNAVTIDNCQRCSIGLSHIIATVELIRCSRVTLYCKGTCPNISLDNCDSVQIFLQREAENCEVITSKSTSTNICRVADDGDYVEFAVPEQVKSQLINNRLVSNVVEHRM